MERSPAQRLARFALAKLESLDLDGRDRPQWNRLRVELEREIMRGMLAGPGMTRVRALVKSLNSLGHRLTRMKTDQGWLSFQEITNAGTRRFIIHAQRESDDGSACVMVLYHETLEALVARRREGMSPTERSDDLLRERFAKRGIALAKRNAPYRSLTEAERLVDRLATLESGVNNGGFAGYLSNGHGGELEDARRFLGRIGARRTERIVTRVQTLLPPGFNPRSRAAVARFVERNARALGRLDAQYYNSPDDLGVLAMRHLQSAR